MEQIADLHIHSRFSRATSKALNIESMYKWSKVKGVNIIGTGDFTHPDWFKEIKDKLEPAEPGLLKLKDNLAKIIDDSLPTSVRSNEVRFVLSTEVSNIYEKNGKNRRIHSIILVPTLSSAYELSFKLSRFSNLRIDGRPVFLKDVKDVFNLVLQNDLYSLLIPAHIWTPWYSLFGSRSGFDSIVEAFDELAPEIRAIETGLSSDPYMNMRVQQLTNLSILSFSDAHSLLKIGREATLFDIELNYYELIDSIRENSDNLIGTLEFFPEEGMYHFDGHRKCNISMSPIESKQYQNMCPECGKPLTLGVLNRIENLADSEYPSSHMKKVEYQIPLIEIITERFDIKNPNSVKVLNEYRYLIEEFGSELEILRTVDTKLIYEQKGEYYEEAIRRLRSGRVIRTPGFDGVYGKIELFSKQERTSYDSEQISLL